MRHLKATYKSFNTTRPYLTIGHPISSIKALKISLFANNATGRTLHFRQTFHNIDSQFLDLADNGLT